MKVKGSAQSPLKWVEDRILIDLYLSKVAQRGERDQTTKEYFKESKRGGKREE